MERLHLVHVFTYTERHKVPKYNTKLCDCMRKKIDFISLNFLNSVLAVSQSRLSL